MGENDQKAEQRGTSDADQKGQLITQKEYADRKGWSKQYVNQLVKQKRIPLQDGKINPVEADAALAESRDPARDKQFRAAPVAEGQAGRAPATRGVTDPSGVFGKARTLREHYRAKKEKLEFEELAGKLVRKDEVEDGIFTSGRMLRDSLLASAQPIGEELAHEFGLEKRKITAAMRKHLREALKKAADTIRGGEWEVEKGLSEE